jgi:predicted dehydrogenase
MLKIGVLGAGHLGKIHLACLQSLGSAFEIVGFHDPDPTVEAAARERFGIPSFPDVDSLVEAAVDAVDIVTPTVDHFHCAKKALERGRHVFIEKPITHTVAEALELEALASERGTLVQVGHVERFNPALLAVHNKIHRPRFIEAHRLSTFQPRGTDVPVVLDLMIHDIDAVLSVVSSEVVDVQATGARVLSETADIANARIAFADGCVANLTASRISLQKMRKMRIFQRDAYITVDFLDKKASVMTFGEGTTDQGWNIDLGENGQKHVKLQPTIVTPTNAIQEELRSFADAVQNGRQPVVPLEDGRRALELAHRILDQIQSPLTVPLV